MIHRAAFTRPVLSPRARRVGETGQRHLREELMARPEPTRRVITAVQTATAKVAAMVLVIVGAVLQIIGLVCAAFGLAQVWGENPQPENLAWRIFGPSIRWVNAKVLRRPRHVTVNAGSANVSLRALAGSAYGTAGLDPTGGTAEQIAQVNGRWTLRACVPTRHTCWPSKRTSESPT